MLHRTQGFSSGQWLLTLVSGPPSSGLWSSSPHLGNHLSLRVVSFGDDWIFSDVVWGEQDRVVLDKLLLANLDLNKLELFQKIHFL